MLDTSTILLYIIKKVVRILYDELKYVSNMRTEINKIECDKLK